MNPIARDDRARLLAVARGDEPADLSLTGGRIVNVLSGEILEADVAVAGGRIASVGPRREAREVVDARGKTLLPGLIDAHVHLESSLTTPAEYARAVVPRGTTAVVCDPHEIANVAGIDGVRWLLDASEDLPLTVFVNAPSCVPASPLATSGATLGLGELVELRRHPRVLGLAEVMNFPGVVSGDETVLSKIAAFRGRPVDGHAPGLTGDALQAYAAAGIATDHECTTPSEVREKLRLGLHILLREGTAARNLLDLIEAVTPETAGRFALCTDDRHPHDLLRQGHIDHLIRLIIESGIDEITAVRLATSSPAAIYGLRERGALSPGRRADIVVCDRLADLEHLTVYCSGRKVAEHGRMTEPLPALGPVPALGAFSVDPGNLSFEIAGPDLPVRVIVARAGRLETAGVTCSLPRRDGLVLPDPDNDIVKMAVVERHQGSGRIGLGFVRGLGLKHGAIAGTVAHDHHNLIIAGVDDRSMRTAARALIEAGGGLAAVRGDEVLSLLPLPIGGLMTDRPLVEIDRALRRLIHTARELGATPDDPFMTLSFLALEVIPELKLTDRGLVDVLRFEIVPLFER